ncbi:MAG: histidine phosphatase family protein [Thermomicrobiales bacterium]
MSSQFPPTLIIVRHAQPEVDPDRPAASWPLSPAGRDAATALGDRLRAIGSLRIITSRELKAIQTGEAIASTQPIITDHRFGEQGLGTVPYLPAGAFKEQVTAHFEQLDAPILGDESSREASVRFDAAINERIGDLAKGTIPTVVSHGRIISAWLTGYARPEHGEPIAASSLWGSLRMPDAFLLRRDSDDRCRWAWSRLDPEGVQ